MSPDEQERMEGVNVSDLEPIVDAVSFPVTGEEIVAEHGDRELQRTNAEPIAIEDLLEPLDDASFESAEDLETMIVGQMPSESTGRSGYSDRGGSQPTGTGEDERGGDGGEDDMANANTATADGETVDGENGDTTNGDPDNDDAESV